MKFVETPVFTRALSALLSEEEYRALQIALLLRPEQGPLIPGGGGLRKLRWKTGRGGKRGGPRLIYYWDLEEQTVYMLLVYAKNRQEDLSLRQLRVLRKLVAEELK